MALLDEFRYEHKIEYENDFIYRGGHDRHGLESRWIPDFSGFFFPIA